METVKVEGLRREALEFGEWANGTGELHGAKELRQRNFETWLVWLTAITAGLSGLSLFGSSQVATAVLSVLTVLLAGTNAAYKPSENAKAHAVARIAFFDLAERFYFFGNYQIPAHDDVPTTEFAQMRDEYLAHFVALRYFAWHQHP
ncbi:MAG: hypothetical protein ACRDK3_15655 [Actinomycetota bacterium]